MFLGLDLGTSGLRALLVDSGGAVIGWSEASCSVSHPHSGWSEQDPADWIAACETCLAALQGSYPTELAALSGIGLSGHMHGATLLDADFNVLRPCMLWNDTRSTPQAAELDAAEHVRELSGNIVFPGFTAPKVAWVAKHEPDIFAQIAKVLLPKDYLRFWLTGGDVSDMSDAAGTAWLDVGARDWSPELLNASDMRADQMPTLVEGTAPAGHLRRELQEKWGISNTVIVAGGAGDNAAAACGVGCFQDGDGFVSLGTSGVLLAAKDRFAPDPATAVHTFCHAVPDTWYQMGVILAATDCLNWLAEVLNARPADLANALPDTISGPSRLLFLPYLSGERTPHNDSAIRGSFIGLDVTTTPLDMTQAVMEGVAFALADCHDALKATGTKFERLLAIGGGTKSDFWVQTLASVLNIQIDIPAQGEFGAALGAARLAMAAQPGADLAAIMTKPEIARTVAPRADLVADYARAHDTYRALYPNLKAALGQ
ncbi:xylulokinase [Aestuariibius sp. HNIBRBA575]|uniref:xylulokinase n=1 Tax=Aestuariibius sp. HNIBRBA575 TaxID=3233343 RepID=UPI0034A2B5B2